MIKGMHTMFYSSQAAELRTFLKDILEIPSYDMGEGWLIFDLPKADLGVHPTGEGTSPSGTHDISFYCENINETVEKLKAKGVEFTMDIDDEGWGMVTRFKVPGDFEVMMYEPKYGK